MNISFYNGTSGMIAYQESLNRISHNIANANTLGYKPSRSSFRDLLYTRMAVNSPEEPLTGHGVRIEDDQLIYRQGALLQTGNTLDYALMGDGFFAVERPDGSVEYTRNGAFDISVEGESGYLVTADGSYVLDGSGDRIELTRGEGEGPFDLEGLADRLGIYDFPNPYGLEPSSGSCFKETGSSGEAEAVTEEEAAEGRQYQVLSGALEQSAVELSDEMVQVIVSQRAFQMNARMVQTADELEQLVNNLRQ